MYTYLKSAFSAYVQAQLVGTSGYDVGAEPWVKDVHALKFDISHDLIMYPDAKFAHHSVSGLAININHQLDIPFFVTIWYQYCHGATALSNTFKSVSLNQYTIFHFVGSAGSDDKSTCFFNNSHIASAHVILAQLHEHGYVHFWLK